MYNQHMLTLKNFAGETEQLQLMLRGRDVALCDKTVRGGIMQSMRDIPGNLHLASLVIAAACTHLERHPAVTELAVQKWIDDDHVSLLDVHRLATLVLCSYMASKGMVKKELYKRFADLFQEMQSEVSGTPVEKKDDSPNA
jgi:hypothetical protein